MDSEREISSGSDYDEFANEIPFVGESLQPFRCEPVFTAAEIQAKNIWRYFPLSYFSFQPVLHDWCNKGCGMLSCLWDGAYKRTLAVNR